MVMMVEVSQVVLVEKVTYEQMQLLVGKEHFQAEGTAKVKTLRQAYFICSRKTQENRMAEKE